MGISRSDYYNSQKMRRGHEFLSFLFFISTSISLSLGPSQQQREALHRDPALSTRGPWSSTGSCGHVLGSLEEAHQDVHSICPGSPKAPFPHPPRALRRQGEPLCTGSGREGWTYLLFAEAGFSVPGVRACWLPMFPAQCWVHTSSSHPTLDPLHPCHKLSLHVPSLATGNQSQEPPGPLSSSLAGSWHPRAAGSGQATLWSRLGWPQTTHWSALRNIAELLSCQVQPGN